MQLTEYKNKELSCLPETDKNSYNSAIKVFNNWLDGRPVNEENIREFLNVYKENAKPSTYNHKVNSLKASLKLIGEMSGNDSTMWQMKIDRIFKRIKLVKLKSGNKKNLSTEEFQKLKKTSDPQTAIIIESLYEMACRISELCNIKLSDCKYIKDHYEIDIIGKGSKQHKVYLKTTTFKKINKLFQGRKYLFEYRVNQKPHRTTIYKKIHQAGFEIGVNISPHVLRHTFATLNLKRLGIHKVSKYLNHADIGITSKFYLHEEASADDILK